MQDHCLVILDRDPPLLHGDPPVPRAALVTPVSVKAVVALTQEAALSHGLGRGVDEEN